MSVFRALGAKKLDLWSRQLPASPTPVSRGRSLPQGPVESLATQGEATSSQAGGGTVRVQPASLLRRTPGMTDARRDARLADVGSRGGYPARDPGVARRARPRTPAPEPAVRSRDPQGRDARPIRVMCRIARAYHLSDARNAMPCSAASSLAGSRRVPSSSMVNPSVTRHRAPVRQARPPALERPSPA